MPFNSFMDILRKIRERHPALSRRLEEADALSRWEECVGAAIAKHARAVRVQDEVLFVEVDHPIWKSELHHRKQQILELLNRPPKAPPEPESPFKPPSQKKGRSQEKETPPAPRPPVVIKDIFLIDPRGPVSNRRFSGPAKPSR